MTALEIFLSVALAFSEAANVLLAIAAFGSLAALRNLRALIEEPKEKSDG